MQASVNERERPCYVRILPLLGRQMAGATSGLNVMLGSVVDRPGFQVLRHIYTGQRRSEQRVVGTLP